MIDPKADFPGQQYRSRLFKQKFKKFIQIVSLLVVINYCVGTD